MQDLGKAINDAASVEQDKDKAAKDIEWQEYQDWLVCRANHEWKKYKDSLVCEKKALEKETKLIKDLLHSYELLYSNNLSEKRVNEVRELSKKLFNGDIILVENEEEDIGEEISAEKIEQARQDSMMPLVFGGVDNPPGFVSKKKEKVSISSAFLKRLRHLKSKRKSKSIVKVITETTLDMFEEQLTKYANNGYKIKYANIDTKAGNSGSGVRYYAVVQRG